MGGAPMQCRADDHEVKITKRLNIPAAMGRHAVPYACQPAEVKRGSHQAGAPHVVQHVVSGFSALSSPQRRPLQMTIHRLPYGNVLLQTHELEHCIDDVPAHNTKTVGLD